MRRFRCFLRSLPEFFRRAFGSVEFDKPDVVVFLRVLFKPRSLMYVSMFFVVLSAMSRWSPFLTGFFVCCLVFNFLWLRYRQVMPDYKKF